MKKLLQFLTIALLIPMSSFAQNNLTLTGFVTNDDGPMANTEVTISTPSTPASPGITIDVVLTDENGSFFSFNDLETPYSNLSISAEGCNNVAYLDSLIYPVQTSVALYCGTGTGGGDDCVSSFYFNSDSLEEGTVYFVNTSMGTDSEYFWDFGDGTESTEANPTHTFPETDAEYNVCLTVYSLDCEDTFCTTVYSGSNGGTGSGIDCEALFVFIPDSAVDGTIYYFNASLGADLEYLWDFGDGSVSTEQYPSHTYADAEAFYNVCLTVFNDSCQNQYCDSVSGTFDGTATGPGLVGNGNQSQQGEGNGTGFTFIVQPNTVLGVKENLKEIDFNIYPNPSNGLVNFNLDIQEVGSIMIADLSGKIVFEDNNINARNSQLNLNNLNDGIYIIQFKSLSFVSTSKLILQR